MQVTGFLTKMWKKWSKCNFRAVLYPRCSCSGEKISASIDRTENPRAAFCSVCNPLLHSLSATTPCYTLCMFRATKKCPPWKRFHKLAVLISGPNSEPYAGKLWFLFQNLRRGFPFQLMVAVFHCVLPFGHAWVWKVKILYVTRDLCNIPCLQLITCW